MHNDTNATMTMTGVLVRANTADDTAGGIARLTNVTITTTRPSSTVGASKAQITRSSACST